MSLSSDGPDGSYARLLQLKATNIFVVFFSVFRGTEVGCNETGGSIQHRDRG